MSKFNLKLQVQAMRRRGKSLKEIYTALGIAKSTAALWCREVELTNAQKKNLHERMRRSGFLGRLKGAEVNRQKKLKAQEDAGIWAGEMIKDISVRDRLIAGAALYWAEGSKAATTTGFIFVNSDPTMIRFMQEWLIDIIKIPKEDITARVSINEIHRYRIRDVLSFWSHLLDLPADDFSKTFFSTSVQKKVYANHETHYGVLRLGVRRGTLLKYKVLHMIGILKAGVAQVVRANAS